MNLQLPVCVKIKESWQHVVWLVELTQLRFCSFVKADGMAFGSDALGCSFANLTLLKKDCILHPRYWICKEFHFCYNQTWFSLCAQNDMHLFT